MKIKSIIVFAISKVIPVSGLKATKNGTVKQLYIESSIVNKSQRVLKERVILINLVLISNSLSCTNSEIFSL